ncbi:MAG TPA: metalloregulator ArsR/SmtB family transcription factor [Mycobacteriales bacterium]|nr:metalloregulator ArsR/SmtB family transcription factor [Mycobacteriales bacterium]
MAANALALLDAIAEPTRRSIVERLADAPASVTDIARDMPISRSAVSQHLQVLKAAGLVTDHAEGTRRVYRVDPDALAVIRAYFDAFWQRSLKSFQDTIRRDENTDTKRETT